LFPIFQLNVCLFPDSFFQALFFHHPFFPRCFILRVAQTLEEIAPPLICRLTLPSFKRLLSLVFLRSADCLRSLLLLFSKEKSDLENLFSHFPAFPNLGIPRSCSVPPHPASMRALFPLLNLLIRCCSSLLGPSPPVSIIFILYWNIYRISLKASQPPFSSFPLFRLLHPLFPLYSCQASYLRKAVIFSRYSAHFFLP